MSMPRQARPKLCALQKRSNPQQVDAQWVWYSHAHNKIKWARSVDAFAAFHIIVNLSFCSMGGVVHSRSFFLVSKGGQLCVLLLSLLLHFESSQALFVSRDGGLHRYERHWNGKKW
jgi:hypothetical protein